MIELRRDFIGTTGINYGETIVYYNPAQSIGKNIRVKDYLSESILHELGHLHTPPPSLLDYYNDAFYWEAMAWLWAVDKSNGLLSRKCVKLCLASYADSPRQTRLVKRISNLCRRR